METIFWVSIFGVPSIILLPKMAPEKTMAPEKKNPTIWAYIGEDGASRMAIWVQKKKLGLLSYCLDVYWGRLRPKNGHLVSEKIVRHFCPTVLADKDTNGTPKMDVLWQDIFQGLLSHFLDTHGSKNGFPKRD